MKNQRIRRILAVAGIIIIALLLWSSCSPVTPAAAPEPVPAPSVSAVKVPEPSPCDSPDLPSVVWTDGIPELKTPAAPAPTELKVIECRKGTGEVLTGEVGSTAYLKFTVASWDENRTLETLWDGVAVVPVTEMNPLYLDAVKGKRVGSQVLVVAPPGDVSDAPEGAYFVPHTLMYFVEVMDESAQFALPLSDSHQ